MKALSFAISVHTIESQLPPKTENKKQSTFADNKRNTDVMKTRCTCNFETSGNFPSIRLTKSIL